MMTQTSTDSAGYKMAFGTFGWALLTLALGLGLAACGDDDDTTDTTGGTNTGGTTGVTDTGTDTGTETDTGTTPDCAVTSAACAGDADCATGQKCVGSECVVATGITPDSYALAGALYLPVTFTPLSAAESLDLTGDGQGDNALAAATVAVPALNTLLRGLLRDGLGSFYNGGHRPLFEFASVPENTCGEGRVTIHDALLDLDGDGRPDFTADQLNAGEGRVAVWPRSFAADASGPAGQLGGVLFTPERFTSRPADLADAEALGPFRALIGPQFKLDGDSAPLSDTAIQGPTIRFGGAVSFDALAQTINGALAGCDCAGLSGAGDLVVADTATGGLKCTAVPPVTTTCVAGVDAAFCGELPNLCSNIGKLAALADTATGGSATKNALTATWAVTTAKVGLATPKIATLPKANDDLADLDGRFGFRSSPEGHLLPILANDGYGQAGLDSGAGAALGEGWSVTVSGPTANGGTVAFVPEANAVRYTPAPDFFGTDTFSYTLTGPAGSDTANVTVRLSGGPGLPTANDDTFDVKLTGGVATLDVLVNDRAGSRVEGTKLVIDSIDDTGLTAGTTTVNAARDRVLFTPGATAVTGTFSYTVAQVVPGDPRQFKSTAQVTVRAVATPDATITAPAAVTTGQTGYKASVPESAGATYAWTITGGTIVTGETGREVTFTAGAIGTLKLDVTVTSAAGEDATDSFTLPVLAPLPEVTIDAPKKITVGKEYIAQASPAAADRPDLIWSWTVEPSEASPVAGADADTFTFKPEAAGPVTLTLTVTNAALDELVVTAAAQAFAPPDATIATDTAVSANATGLSASVPAQSGAAYEWTLTGTTPLSDTDADTVLFAAGPATPPGVILVDVRVVNGAGDEATNTKTVTIYPANPGLIEIIGPDVATAGDLDLLFVAFGPDGANFEWAASGASISGPASGIAQDTIRVNTPTPGQAKVTLSLTNLAGDTVTGEKAFTVAPLPLTPSINAPNRVFEFSGNNALATLAQPGMSYFWELTNGTITAGQGTNELTFTAGSIGSVGVTLSVTNAAGVKLSNTILVPVKAAPLPLVISAPDAVTSNLTGYIALIDPTPGESYLWTAVNGNITDGSATGSIKFQAGLPGTTRLTVIATDPQGGTREASVDIPVYASPTLPRITVGANLTSGKPGYTASIPTQASATYSWTIVNGTITSATNRNTITFTPGEAGIALRLTATVTNPAGTASTGIQNAQVVAAPDKPVIVAPSIVTAGATGVTASVPFKVGNSYQWSLNNALLTSPTNRDVTIAFTAGTSGVVTLTLRVSNAAGDFNNVTKTVTIVAAPISQSIVTALNTTAGQTGLVASVTPQIGMSYNWSVSNGAITAGQGTNSISYTAGVAGSNTISVTISNAADTPAQVNAEATVNVAEAPVVTSFAVEPVAVFAGETAVLVAEFKGGEAQIEALTPAQPANTAANTVAKTETPAHGALGARLSDETKKPVSVAVGGGLAWQVRPKRWAVTTGEAVESQPIAGTQTFRLTVTSPTGAKVEKTVTVRVYDNRFVARGRLVVPRTGHTATLLDDGRVLVAGGVDGAGRAVALREVVDPAAGTSSIAPASLGAPAAGAKAATERATAVLPNGFALATGLDPDDAPVASSLTRWVAPKLSGATVAPAAPSLLTPRTGHTATTLPDGRVLVIGGLAAGELATGIEVYE
jgi:hypothetical protein